jgi:cell fate regulator YaaT (PSP1 superfamily)
MTEVVGVRFKGTGKVYYFDPSGIELKLGDGVVVETARGLELGQVVKAPFEVQDDEVTQPLKPVVRRADDEDIERADKLKQSEAGALTECNKLVAKLGLPMKLISAEYNLDGSRLTVFFTAEGRVDFRELVRGLSHNLKARVELRQVGPRDEAKLIGGFGRCGRHLCCASFLTEFSPVSIKMAKEQQLPLNPMKISGICGRLLCCLGYEYEQYRVIRRKMPKKGQRVTTAKGTAFIVGTNPLKETVMVELDGGVRVEMPVGEVTVGGAGEVVADNTPNNKKLTGPRRRR